MTINKKFLKLFNWASYISLFLAVVSWPVFSLIHKYSSYCGWQNEGPSDFRVSWPKCEDILTTFIFNFYTPYDFLIFFGGILYLSENGLLGLFLLFFSIITPLLTVYGLASLICKITEVLKAKIKVKNATN